MNGVYWPDLADQRGWNHKASATTIQGIMLMNPFAALDTPKSLDNRRQPVTQAVSGERECHVVEAHQQDAAIEQRPKSVFVVCFLHSAVFGCQRLAQPVLFFGV